MSLYVLRKCSEGHLHPSAAEQVDVGVFWTSNAQKAVGGAPQMQAKIRAAVVATNAVYAASKLKLRLRLVFMGERNGLPQPNGRQHARNRPCELEHTLGLIAAISAGAHADLCPAAHLQVTLAGTQQTRWATTWRPR